jgi:hypothetical protein
MKALIQQPDETYTEWLLRLSNVIADQQQQIADLKRRLESRVAFDLSADSTPMLLRPQAG